MLRRQFFLLNDLDPRQKGKAASSLSYAHKVKSISSIFLVLKNAYIAAKKTLQMHKNRKQHGSIKEMEAIKQS